MEKFGYNGPFALSCDDTKLHTCFHPYFDSKRQAFVVLGSIGEPYIIPSPESLRDAVERGVLQKATKVFIRLRVLI